MRFAMRFHILHILALSATVVPLSALLRQQRPPAQVEEEAALLAKFLVAFSYSHLSTGNLVVCLQASTASTARAAGWSLGALVARDMLARLHRHGKLPLVVDCPGSRVVYDGVKYHNFVMLRSDAREVVGALAAGLRHDKDDRRGTNARLLVAILGQVGQPGAGGVADIMEALWAASWGQVVVVVHEGGAELSLYTMAPFANSSGLCGRASMQVQHLSRVRLSDAPSGRWLPLLPPLPPLYGGLVPRDLRGCVVRAGTYIGMSELCGRTEPDKELQLPLETRVVRDIMRLAGRGNNYRTLWIPDHTMYEMELDNGTFNGTLGNLQNNMYDVAVATYSLTVTRMRYLQPTVPFYETAMAVWVRCPTDHGLHHLNILQARMGLFLMLALTYGVTVVAKVVVARCGATGRPTCEWWYAAAAKSALDVWSMLCEVSSPGYSHAAPSLAVRCLVAGWLFFVLNMNVDIKGLLTAQSATAPPPRRIRTLEELTGHKPPFNIMYAFHSSRDALVSLGVRKNQLEMCEGEGGVLRCENRFKVHENLAIISVRGLPSSFKCMPQCYYSLRHNLKRVSLVMYAKKSFPLKHIVDRTILRLQSAGLIDQWIIWDWARRERFWRFQKVSSRTTTNRNGTSSLVWAALQCLLLGLLVSALVCVLEVARGRFSLAVLTGKG